MNHIIYLPEDARKLWVLPQKKTFPRAMKAGFLLHPVHPELIPQNSPMAHHVGIHLTQHQAVHLSWLLTLLLLEISHTREKLSETNHLISLDILSRMRLICGTVAP